MHTNAHLKKGHPSPAVNTKLQERFLAAYRECGTIRAAAEAARCGRRSHYNWLKTDATYPERFQDADQEAGESLISEARRRALDEKSAASATLLIFLIKARYPEYRDNYRMHVAVTPEQPKPQDQGKGEALLEQLLHDAAAAVAAASPAGDAPDASK